MNHYTLNLKIIKLEERIKVLQKKIQEIYYRELVLIEDMIYVKDTYGNVYDIFEPKKKLGIYINNKFIVCNFNEELESDEYISI